MAKTTKQLKITLIKSGIGRPERQKNTLIGLGLTKVNRTVVREDTPSNRGMVNKISHLVTVESV